MDGYSRGVSLAPSLEIRINEFPSNICDENRRKNAFKIDLTKRRKRGKQ